MTGGLLREPELSQRQAAFDRQHWRQQQGVRAQSLAISLFCYEPAALPEWLQQCAAQPDWQLLVTPGRATAAVQEYLDKNAAYPLMDKRKQLLFLNPCSQAEFDHLLWACDLNLVRGEDSLVRALWAGQPLLWHIYPQDDGAHLVKLHAFLDWLQAPADLRQWHAHWNEPTPADTPATLPAVDWHRIRQAVQTARDSLLAQPDLLTQLEQMVQAMRQAGTPDTPPDIR